VDWDEHRLSRRLKLRDLNVLLTVARCGSMGKAAEQLAVSQPAISRHVKVLEEAGLISRRRRATARLSHLEAEPLRGATEWLAAYRRFWTESHERLDELLQRLLQEDQ